MPVSFSRRRQGLPSGPVSPYIVGALIAGGGGLLVWCLTTIHESRAENRRAREREQIHLRAALANYLAALDSLTLEVMQEPAPPEMNALDRGLDSAMTALGLSDAVAFLARILQRLVYGRRYGDLTDRVAQASAELRLVAPPKVLDLMQELDAIPHASPGRCRLAGRLAPDA